MVRKVLVGCIRASTEVNTSNAINPTMSSSKPFATTCDLDGEAPRARILSSTESVVTVASGMMDTQSPHAAATAGDLVLKSDPFKRERSPPTVSSTDTAVFTSQLCSKSLPSSAV